MVGCLLLLSFVTVISWGLLIWKPSFKLNDDNVGGDCKAGKNMCLEGKNCDANLNSTGDSPRVLLSVLVLVNGLFDALAWFLLHKFTTNQQGKIKKEIDINIGHNRTDTALIADNETEHEGEDVQSESSKSEEKEQNVSNALRGEIIAYMTAGLANGIFNTSKQTYEKIYSYGDVHMMNIDFTQNGGSIDMDINGVDYDSGDDDQKLNKTNQASYSRNKQDMLLCDEPEPGRSQYPTNITQDPKTHPGVVNQLHIKLQTQKLEMATKGIERIKRFQSRITVNHNIHSSSKQNSIDIVDTINNGHSEITNNTIRPHKLTEIEDDHDEDQDEELLSSLSVNNNNNNNDESDNDNDNDNDDEVVAVYESGTSDVEMSQRSSSQRSHKEREIKVVEPKLNDDEPEIHRQISTASNAAGIIFGSITKTLSRVATTLNTEPINTGTTYQSFPDPMFGDENYSFYTEEKKQGTKDGIPFKDYAPHVFRYLRQQIYEISDEEYLQSVRPPESEEQSKKIQEQFSEGRSGAFFFFTHDSKYIIKTVTKEEALLLLRILPDFVQHFNENRKSLINRFFGLHSMEMYNLNLYFVVLENVFVAGSKPHEIYDIKGSWIDRHTNHHVESGKLMKDQDLHKTLKLIPDIADGMYKQLKADSKFLASQNIMDYSVLLGIYYVGIDPSDVKKDRIMKHHHDNNANSSSNYIPPIHQQDDNYFEDEQKSKLLSGLEPPKEMEYENSYGGYDQFGTIRAIPDDFMPSHTARPRAPSYASGIKKYAQKDKAVKARVIEGPGIYYLGIIDVLQEWNTMKKLERLAKVYLRCKSSHGISCVEPAYYRTRFLRKMKQIGIKPFGKSIRPINDY